MGQRTGGDLMRVLVADDERLLADTVAEGLRRLSIAVDVCYDGEAALELVSVHRYDVAVLDRDMPGRTGHDLTVPPHANRAGVRGLILTAGRGIRDRVDGLSLGADVCVCMNACVPACVAGWLALGRRSGAATPPV